MINKEEFVKLIDAIEKQYNYDIEYGEKLSQALGFDDNVMYKNEILIDGIVNYLVSQFLDKDFTEAMINNFMWDYEFGKHGEIKGAKDLYEKLVCCEIENKAERKLLFKEKDQSQHMYNLISDVQKWHAEWMKYGSCFILLQPDKSAEFIEKLSRRYNVTPKTNDKD